MQHATFRGQGRIDVTESPEPRAGQGEVLLRVLACALCGSDLRPLRNGWPLTPGHEVVGRVDQPGHALHGRRCLVYIPVWCGHCPSCQAGDTHLCENATELVGWQRNGGYAEALTVPEQCLLPVPDDVPTHLAPLLLDTIGTAAHGVRLSQALVPAGRVLVLGAGPIGLGALLVLQHFGYGPIDVLDPNDFRRRVAGELGGRPVTEPDAQRYPLVLECSGKDAARQTALESVAGRGVVVQLGEADAWQVAETKAIRRKDFYMVRSFYFPKGDHEANLALLRRRRASYEQLVDHVFPMAQMAAEFPLFMAGERIKPLMRAEG